MAQISRGKQGRPGSESPSLVFLGDAVFDFLKKLFGVAAGDRPPTVGPEGEAANSAPPTFPAVRLPKKNRQAKVLSTVELLRRLGGSLDLLNPHLDTTYRETFIAKKRGGQRRLLVPNDKLKALQRRILHKLLRRLRAHPAAKGFERKQSIVDNAMPHVGRRVVVKMDIVDFFPSCKAETVTAYFRRLGWDEAAAGLLTRLCTHEGC